MPYALAIACGYLAGSLPFGYWLVRVRAGIDIRTVGSGSIGASNVGRVLGRRYEVLVALLDGAKGFVPALVFTLAHGHLYGALAGAGAIAGHYRPVFLRFQKGGKMVATAGGVVFALAPYAAAIGLAVWLVVKFSTKYSSVASLSVAVAVPLSSYLLGYPWPVTVFALGASVGVVLLHRPNISRLRTGTESKSASRASRSRWRGGDAPAAGRMEPKP